MQKNLDLIAKYFKKIYKPTNNNLRTSSNSKNKHVDTTPSYKNDDHSRQFGNQRTSNVAGIREKVGSPVVQNSGIQCFNCKEYGHFAKECRKPKRVKDSYDWLADTNEEVDEQELEAHYSYMAKIQEVPTADSGTDSEPVKQVQNDVGYNVFANHLQHSEQSESISNTRLVETDDSNVIPDSPDMCEDDIQNDQNDVESDDERVVLANLIANLKLDVDKNKKIQKQLKKANTTLAQELKECKAILAETNQFRATTAQDMEIPIQTCLMPLAIKTQNDSFKFVHELKQEMHVDLKYVKSLEKEIDELKSDKAEFSDMYDVILQECVSKDVMCSYLQSLSDLDALAELQCMYLHKVKECDCLAQKLSKQTESISKKVHTELLQRFAKVEKHLISLEIALQKCKEQFLKLMCRKVYQNQSLHRLYLKEQDKLVNHKPTVSRPRLKSNQSKDKVLPYNIQVKAMKTQVEVHPRIPSVSNKMKSVTACKDNLNSKTLNANAVCATCNKCLVDSNHFACVTKMLNDVHDRTKKPNVVLISARKPKSQANKAIATPHKKKVASKSTDQKPQSYFRVMYENTSKIVQLIIFIVDYGCTKHMTGNLKLLCNFVEKFPGTVRFGNDQDGKNLDKMKEKGDQCILVGYSTQSKGYRVSTNIQSTSAPSTYTNVHAEENNNDQAEEGEQLQDDEFTNPFCAPTQEEAESSSRNIGNSNVPTFNKPQVFKYRWTKDYLLQVCGNPSRPVQTRRQLTTDPEMCMYALTVSTAEPKNIKEAMADSAWIEAMQEELHQFDRL
nr:Gag-Pol polyprotein [Tanacetum cinerariifolium]